MTAEAFVTFPSDPAAIWQSFEDYRGDLAFDVGANGGAVVAKLAPHFGTVVAFEPCAESFVHLERTAPANVVAVPMAVSDHDGEVVLNESRITDSFGELSTGDSLVNSWGEATGSRQVPCLTLDAAEQTYGVPDFIKIDTEGHELLIVQGGRHLLAIHHPALMIEVHSELNGAEIVRTLGDYDFTRVDHPAYRPDSYYRQNHYYLVAR